jgi:hypothetical protein
MSFHITITGKVGVCTATNRACPLGGAHYESREDAEFAAMSIDIKAPGTDVLGWGKHRHGTERDLLADRGYCGWLLKQKWLRTEPEYKRLYIKVKRSFDVRELRADFYKL